VAADGRSFPTGVAADSASAVDVGLILHGGIARNNPALFELVTQIRKSFRT
jgi:hypothetical protein